jgi:DNA-binding response OmpR family regulator
MTEETKVLVVEDDEATAEFLLDNLRADGYRAAAASGVGEALRAIEVRQPDVVLLDLVLEDGNGLELIDRVRASDGLASRLDPELPVIVLSGRTEETDRVRGFARGCDDYVGKPFSYPELHARIRAVLRRAADRSRKGVVRVGPLVIDPITRRVRLDGRPVHLSAKEFSLLQALASDPTAVFPKERLLRDVWGYVSMGNTRTLDAHACRLRKKLAASPRPFVLNLRGVGYRLTEAL